MSGREVVPQRCESRELDMFQPGWKCGFVPGLYESNVRFRNVQREETEKKETGGT